MSEMRSPQIKTLTWLTLFCIAMGFLESSVVVYLRELYYPEGFRFPLSPIEKDIVTTEFWREIATVIMLLGVAMRLHGRQSSRYWGGFQRPFCVPGR
jgi:hypothetical protein